MSNLALTVSKHRNKEDKEKREDNDGMVVRPTSEFSPEALTDVENSKLHV